MRRLTRSLSRAPSTWQRGLVIALMVAVTLASSGLMVLFALVLGNGLLGLLGAGFPEDNAITAALWLSPLWAPFAIGYAARHFPDAEAPRSHPRTFPQV